MISAEIVSTGTELLLGQSLNTNAQYLAERLAGLGVYCFYQTTVGDNPVRIRSVIEKALERADLVITTGGLGPTMDDLTKEVVAEIFGLPMETDPEVLGRIEAFFQRRGRLMPENNTKQALIPAGARIIPNHLGTAPGIIVEGEGKTVILLPGPPFEMKPMFEETVAPYLAERTKVSPGVLHSKTLKVVGPGESVVEDRLRDLLQASNPTIALLAKTAEVHVRLTARAPSVQEAEAMIAGEEAEIRRRLHPFVYGADEETLASVAGRLLSEQKRTLAAAESCTGGYISHLLTNVAGSSAYFLLGITSYSNEAKAQVLGVDEAILQRHGAVSPETALAMACGARRLSGADVALAVTGIAGPGGGSEEKPVGLVYMALAADDREEVEKLQFFGDRVTIKEKTAFTVLNRLRLYLTGDKGNPDRPGEQ
ncbi:competence/damage-inducible protein A [Heliobacterium gestii]|uniref:Putative competence-damage inducible protein n=1 Tax=Heliomicrobium gestii TaxID=2699 RepID=A0A845LDV7_HELGE|nr:competence/damage-inducible protein A [Heliomicrobium gestii]MBM7867186.1 nicotinamide-nucleotide amidase [Heliomicrobium gestii]MZP43741.1 competence/damage-inducible protein A [Heliomicrobium gestii]